MQTLKFIAKREAILDAAARHFNRTGLAGATLADIAGSVDLLTNSVTYYYRRKDDLVAACLQRAIDVTRAVVAEAGQAPTPEARIRAFVDGYAQLLATISSGGHDELVNFNDIRTLRPPHVDRVFADYLDMYRDVRRLIPKERFSPTARNARAHLLLSIVLWMRRWIVRFEPDDYGYVARLTGDMILAGFSPRAPVRTAPPLPDVTSVMPVNGDSAVSEAFLRAATTQVNEQGFRGASVARIAARLNLTKGSLYHHYASKDELVSACFERTFDVIRRTQRMAMERLDRGWDRLVASSSALVLFQLSEQGPLVRTTAWNALQEAPRAEAQKRLDRLTERFGMFIVEAMIEGSIAPIEPAIAAQLVGSMINAASELGIWAPALAPDDAFDVYVRPLFAGILAEERA